jgi:hypothetical protein
MKEVYQHLYDNNVNDYGRADTDRCPSVRYLPLFGDYITGFVVEFGCGRAELRKHLSHYLGIDWITHEGVLNADITQPMRITYPKPITGLCIDVFEHIDDQGLIGLCSNLKQCSRQIISVYEGSHVVNGIELHINQKTIKQWLNFISNHFSILDIIYLDAPNRVLFITENYANKYT